MNKCYHCGDDCIEEHITLEEKFFCCEGCKLVYELLNQNGLCEYYDIESNPGISQRMKIRPDKFAYLDDALIIRKLIQFSDAKQSNVTFYLPQMHCSSCIWLLENLPKLNKGILASTVNFPKREVTIAFSNEKCSLRKVAELLTSIGYEPHISLNDIDANKVKKYDRSRIFKVGVAGFCFGNIMMLSFPEYFSFGHIAEAQMGTFFSYLNLLLALPVFFYASSEFYISAYKGLKQKILNIDVPIVLAITITFARSCFDILTHTGPGYLDSMSGVVFFMLIGRIFQDRTFQTLSFDRDYKSYFPVSVTIKKEAGESTIPVSNIKVGDRIVVRNNELIPADAILFYGKANIDYSFVTGESAPVEKSIGEIIYAGGKQVGSVLELEVVKEVSQSYLTQLWNKEPFRQDQVKGTSFIHILSQQFTWILFAIAAITAVYWYVVEPSRMFIAVTSVLLVACPCALLLASTFTNGNMVRIFGKNHFYLKNAEVIENISKADTIIFDKTGTITQNGQSAVTWIGPQLTTLQINQIRCLVKQSSHPLSQSIFNYLPTGLTLKLDGFIEVTGKGMEATIEGVPIRMGSELFITHDSKASKESGTVYVEIDNKIRGHFKIEHELRSGFAELVSKLQPHYTLALISGDNSSQKVQLQQILGSEATLLFNQSPEDKLEFIERLQSQNHTVIMLGDGLNDAGALKRSDIGIAVSDNINNFSPACDAILTGDKLNTLYNLILYAKAGKKIILTSFIVSVLYNIVSMSFAVQGKLSPVMAAILMPISSVSIVLITTGFSSIAARRYKL